MSTTPNSTPPPMVQFSQRIGDTTVTITGAADTDDQISDAFGSFLAASDMVASSNLAVGRSMRARGLPDMAAPTPIDYACRNLDGEQIA